MVGQPGLFDLDQRYAALSAAGDPLERLAAVVDFALCRDHLEAALDRSDRAKGGRPPYDAVLMFKVLVLQTLYTLSDDQTEYQIRDRLSFMRFVGLALEDRVPDAKTIWLFREQLMRRSNARQRRHLNSTMSARPCTDPHPNSSNEAPKPLRRLAVGTPTARHQTDGSSRRTGGATLLHAVQVLTAGARPASPACTTPTVAYRT